MRALQKKPTWPMTFTHAIVRTPCRRLVEGLTSAGMGPPDYHRALEQHACYVTALEARGLTITALPPLEEYPDSTFVEDVALCTPRCAVITRPGAPSRRGETGHIRDALERFRSDVYAIEAPGAVEAGDIMMAGERFFIGLTGRTNREGARQMTAFLDGHGYRAETVAVGDVLHLKSGVSYLEKNTLLAVDGLAGKPGFRGFNVIKVDAAEAYAANSVWVNGAVLTPAGFPATRERITAAGYEVIEVDVSEFRKLDGGLSCLSLRL